MGAGVTFVIIAGIVGVTWLLADALDAVDAQVEDLFGDDRELGDAPALNEGLKVGSNSGGGGGGINATDLRGSHKDVIARRHKEGL